MTGVRQPELPPGRDFDYINAEVIEKKLEREGRRADVAARHDLSRAGAAGAIHDAPGSAAENPRPRESRGHRRRPAAVALAEPGEFSEVRRRSANARPRSLGPGRPRSCRANTRSAKAASSGARVSTKFWPRSARNRISRVPRSSASRIGAVRTRTSTSWRIRKPRAVTTTAAFRVGGKAPELWWPDSGRIERPAVYDAAEGVVRLPLSLGPQGSVFVVFRAPSRAQVRTHRLGHAQRRGNSRHDGERRRPRPRGWRPPQQFHVRRLGETGR